MPPSVPRIEIKDPLVGMELEGRYHILEKIGAGAMSSVYLADQMEGGPRVAIKVLQDHLVSDADQKERFEREARALFAMEHPNILRVFDFGVVRGSPFLVMEHLEGRTLDRFVEEALPDPDTGVSLVKQILSGLASAHAQGVLHRDLKAENVFVTTGPDGNPLAKLLDFGLVKFTDDDRWGEGKALTAYGEVFGTPAYMSPEQCTGAPVDARSDVYGMGAVLFEMLTGVWPYMEETRVEMLRAHLMAPIPKLADVRPELVFRPELETVIRTALAKEQGERFADAGRMLAALDRVPSPVAAPVGDAQGFAATPQIGLGTPPAFAEAPAWGGTATPWLLLALMGGGLFLLLAAVAAVFLLL